MSKLISKSFEVIYSMSNAKSVALIVTFSGLAIVLNPAISGLGVPFPLAPSLLFQIWDIPLLVAFLLFGFKVAVPSGLINIAFLSLIFPGPGRPYFFTHIFGSIGMMIALYIAYKIAIQKDSTTFSRTKFLTFSIALAILFRALFMSTVLFGIYYFDPFQVLPDIPIIYVATALLPLQIIFHIILCTYMVPTSYLIAKVVSKNLKMDNEIL